MGGDCRHHHYCQPQTVDWHVTHWPAYCLFIYCALEWAGAAWYISSKRIMRLFLHLTLKRLNSRVYEWSVQREKGKRENRSPESLTHTQTTGQSRKRVNDMKLYINRWRVKRGQWRRSAQCIMGGFRTYIKTSIPTQSSAGASVNWFMAIN